MFPGLPEIHHFCPGNRRTKSFGGKFPPPLVCCNGYGLTKNLSGSKQSMIRSHISVPVLGYNYLFGREWHKSSQCMLFFTTLAHLKWENGEARFWDRIWQGIVSLHKYVHFIYWYNWYNRCSWYKWYKHTYRKIYIWTLDLGRFNAGCHTTDIIC